MPRAICTAVIVTTCIAAAAALSGCKNGDTCSDGQKSAQCTAVKPGTVTTVNAMCVVENEDPVDPSVEPAMWKGEKVGFCCKGCKPKWDKMTDAQKDAAVAKARTLKPKA